MIAFASLILIQSIAAPATAISVMGRVEVTQGETTQPLVALAQVDEGALVRTYEGARVSLRLASGTLVRLGPETTVKVAQLQHQDPPSKRKEGMRLVTGRLWAKVMSLFGDDSRFEVETPNAVAGVRGTAFFAEAGATADRFVTDDGTVHVRQGESSAILDGPGAAISSDAAGLGAPTHTEPGELADMRRLVAGAAGALIADLGRSERELPEGSRQLARDTILGLDALSDVSVQGAGPLDAPSSAAELTIRLRLP